MKLLKPEMMIVTCEHCKAKSHTDALDDFREFGRTYPPTIFFVCPDCKHESRVFNPPNRLLQHMAVKICKERGYNTTYHFDNGESVTA